MDLSISVGRQNSHRCFLDQYCIFSLHALKYEILIHILNKLVQLYHQYCTEVNYQFRNFSSPFVLINLLQILRNYYYYQDVYIILLLPDQENCIRS